MFGSAYIENYRSGDRRRYFYLNRLAKHHAVATSSFSLTLSPRTAMVLRTSMLDILPVELLLLIKDHIPDVDLRTHVCFSQVCGSASKAVYSELEWEKACVKFGLSLVEGEDEETVSWRDLVYEVIRRDGFCDHPLCGVRRLEQNYYEMSKLSLKDYTRNSLQRILDGETICEMTGSYTGFMSTNTLLAHVDFSRDPHTRVANDGFLRTRGAPQQYEHHSPRSALFNHPIAYRSFATFAPTSSAQLVTLGSIPIVRNPSGVTVWDVFSAVQSRLDASDSIHRMNEYLRFVDYRKALCSRVDDLTFLLNRLTSLREFFHIFRWDGLYYAGQDSNRVPCFAIGFKTVRKVVKGVPEPQLICAV
ncbi:hypothetical protein BXZ70DRAFT_903288 [Cristinia sonorae]|uniref:F-box domain-containing protein n=1 Tax=Cristinia sonorae TaxID=1940300 RepID=A0A8K0UYF0_9AGAR|nr:hypothetical protein BXZ70DRAFT_903288 [Cristinia sonorae]